MNMSILLCICGIVCILISLACSLADVTSSEPTAFFIAGVIALVLSIPSSNWFYDLPPGPTPVLSTCPGQR